MDDDVMHFINAAEGSNMRKFLERDEPLELDMTLASGAVVRIRGRATVFPGKRRIYVEPGLTDISTGLVRSTCGDLLAKAVRERLIGSDILRGAVTDGYSVMGVAS